MDGHKIRNTVLLGHSGSGKTTFAETMLFEAGAIKRRGSVEDGSTTSDFTNIEKERGNSLFSSLMHAHWKDSKINIIDTPGSDDFIGEVVSSLKVADTALVVLNATQGVEVGTEIIWEHIHKNQTPSLFVINQIDHDKSNYQNTLEQAQSRFGNKVVAIQYPLNQGAEFDTIVDALRMTMYKFGADGGKPEKVAIPEDQIAKAQEIHNQLVEIAAENDEGLMEKFFDEGTLSEEELTKGLRIALANGDFFPVFICSATQNKGSGRIMGFVNDVAPTPADRKGAFLADGSRLSLDDGNTSLFIYKTLSEPQVGMVSYFKVCSGELKAGDELVNASNRGAERFNQMFVAEGKNRKAVENLKAGDIGVTVKLKSSHTNDTLSVKGTDRKITPIEFPAPRMRTAIQPSGKGDMEKLMKSLQSIAEEDPTLIVEQSKSLKQTILHGQGQLHLDLIKYRVEKVNNLNFGFEKPKIAYRETITRSADTHYRHKKQSGGSGQFAEVHMRIEPYYEDMPLPADLTIRKEMEDELPWGGKLVFLWCIVGGSIDAKYINAIKKGILQKMEDGPLTGSYCQNIRVSVFDGKMHAVDSNDMAFMLAAGNAFKTAFNEARPKLLEPIYDVEILCADDVMGEIMGDLQTRRAMIVGMGAEGHYQKVMAKVPLAEMYKYSSTLRSLSQGRAKFKRAFAEYAEMPADVQARIVAQQEEVMA